MCSNLDSTAGTTNFQKSYVGENILQIIRQVMKYLGVSRKWRAGVQGHYKALNPIHLLALHVANHKLKRTLHLKSFNENRFTSPLHRHGFEYNCGGIPCVVL